MNNVTGPNLTPARLAQLVNNNRSAALGRPTEAQIDQAFADANGASRAAADMIAKSLFHPMTMPANSTSVNRGALEYSIGRSKLDDADFQAAVKSGAEMVELTLQHYGHPTQLEVSFTKSEGTKWSDFRPILNGHIKAVPLEKQS